MDDAQQLLDWGALSYLYGFASPHVQDAVADACGLLAPQLTSWLKALNLVRNTCAHHGRLFIRVHTITPNLLGTLMPAIREYVGANAGTHVVHTGGDHPSYLQLPVREK
ncbi:Abi family protein [Luteimicrobium sp. NPDC057192]|uniref:Abi family protein n=1 Tax=Luteimicrobium sp. NPDC057192 TaxID=3346042 RepID=UPI0036271C7B